jgi:hypothetical protein
MESISGKPHIFAAAGNGKALLSGVVIRRARMENRAYVSLPFEYSNGLSSRSCVEFRPHAQEEQHARHQQK